MSADIFEPRQRDAFQEDFTTFAGAKKLKERIEAKWAERGLNVKVELIERGFDNITRHSRYDIRSEMVDGQPKAQANG